jgi:hypothetical protein
VCAYVRECVSNRLFIHEGTCMATFTFVNVLKSVHVCLCVYVFVCVCVFC